MMDEDISHSIDLPPRDFRMQIPEVLRDSTRSFTYDLKMVDNPGLNQLILIEQVLALIGILPDSFNSFLDIA